MVRLIKIYSLSKFQVYNTVVLNIITILYIRCPVLKLEVCALWPTSPCFSHVLSSGNHQSSSLRVKLSLDSTCKWCHTVFVFLCQTCTQYIYTCIDVCVYIYIFTFPLSVRLLVALRWFPYLGYCEHYCSDMGVQISLRQFIFNFFG